MNGAGRDFLGRDYDMGGRRKVFQIPEALEIDEASFFRIERTRVYFDDVLAITRHKQIGWAYVLFNSLFAGFFGLMAVIGLTQDETEMFSVFVILAAPFVLAILVRAIFRVDIISVYGKRTMARMKFWFRKARAQEIYRDLTLKIRAQQEKVAASQPKPVEPEIPLPPPPPVADTAPGAPPSLPGQEPSTSG